MHTDCEELHCDHCNRRSLLRSFAVGMRGDLRSRSQYAFNGNRTSHFLSHPSSGSCCEFMTSIVDHVNHHRVHERDAWTHEMNIREISMSFLICWLFSIVSIQ